MTLRDYLQQIYDERGQLTPALVVDAARNPEHPLHTRFEWDDSIAAEQYRRVQAGELIRKVKVRYIETPNSEPQRVRAFVPVRQDDFGPANFVPVEQMADDMTARLVLRDFERALARLKAEYGHLTQYAELLRRAADAA